MSCCVDPVASSCLECSHYTRSEFCGSTAAACTQCGGSMLCHVQQQTSSTMSQPPPSLAAIPVASSGLILADSDAVCDSHIANHPLHRDCRPFCHEAHAADHCAKCSCRDCSFCVATLLLHLPPPQPNPPPPRPRSPSLPLQSPCSPPPDMPTAQLPLSSPIPPIPKLPRPLLLPRPPRSPSPPSPIDPATLQARSVVQLSGTIALVACAIGCARQLAASLRSGSVEDDRRLHVDSHLMLSDYAESEEDDVF